MKIVGVDIDDLGTQNVLVAAAFFGIKFEFDIAKGTCCASPAKKSAFSEIKHCVTVVFDRDLGTFCGHMSICRHFMEMKKDGDDEKSLFLRGDVSSWIEFLYERLYVGSRCQSISKVDAESDSHLAKCIKAIDNFLASKTFLVSEVLTIADFVCVITVDYLIRSGKLDASFVEDQLINLSRFIRTVKASDVYKLHTDRIETFKSTGSLFGVVMPEKTDKKAKCPLDLLPPSSFALDAWKRTYSNCKGDFYAELMPWLWENFDPSGWSFYFMKYNKLEDECTSEIFTSNMLSGFLQRFATEFRRYSFGVINVMGSEGSFDIMGVWLIRGLELPEFVTEHPSFEFQTFTKLDIDDPSDKRKIEDYFCACDSIDGVPISSSKVWK